MANSTRNKKVSKPATESKTGISDRIARKFKEQKKKKLADMYKFHDPCAHIRSVGNGL